MAVNQSVVNFFLTMQMLETFILLVATKIHLSSQLAPSFMLSRRHACGSNVWHKVWMSCTSMDQSEETRGVVSCNKALNSVKVGLAFLTAGQDQCSISSGFKVQWQTCDQMEYCKKLSVTQNVWPKHIQKYR